MLCGIEGMAMYRHTNTGPKSLKVTERPIYGSKRIGSYTGQKELAVAPTITNYPYTQPMQAPLKRYELTDHLGNVATVVTGRLLDGAGAGSPKQAEVVSAQGYEAFGSLLPGRNYSSDSYRFGFNGKLNDNEVYGGEGTFQDYGMRDYDTRIARFIRIDPIANQFPWYTPFQFAGNKPIWAIDLDGMEELIQPFTKAQIDGVINVQQAHEVVVDTYFKQVMMKLIPYDGPGNESTIPGQLRGKSGVIREAISQRMHTNYDESSNEYSTVLEASKDKLMIIVQKGAEEVTPVAMMAAGGATQQFGVALLDRADGATRMNKLNPRYDKAWRSLEAIKTNRVAGSASKFLGNTLQLGGKVIGALGTIGTMFDVLNAGSPNPEPRLSNDDVRNMTNQAMDGILLEQTATPLDKK